MNPWVIGGSAIAAGLLGWWLGTNHVEGKWAKADNRALKEQRQLYDEAVNKRDELQQMLDENLARLAESETKRAQVSRRLQEEIERGPIVRTVTKKVPGECEDIDFPVVDVARHYILWNNSITRPGETLPDPIAANFGNVTLRQSSSLASLDGNH